MTPTHPRPRLPLRAAAAAAVLAILTTAAACSSGGSEDAATTGSSVDQAPVDQADADAGQDAGGDAAMTDRADGTGLASTADLAYEAEATDEGSVAAPVGDVVPDGPAVISTGWVELEAGDVGAARFEIRKIVDAHRGTVTEQETSTGEGGEVATTRMVLRVPSARFADAMAELEGTGTLTDSSSSGQDVSAEVVDVDARVRAQRKSVARIEALLARAVTIQQVVSVESQLATRQADLDALLSRQKWLADQTSLSTITVYVQQPDAGAEEPEDDRDGFLDGLRDGWDSFVDALVAGGTVLGFVVPWLVALALLGLPLWLALRRRTRRPAPAPTPAP